MREMRWIALLGWRMCVESEDSRRERLRREFEDRRRERRNRERYHVALSVPDPRERATISIA